MKNRGKASQSRWFRAAALASKRVPGAEHPVSRWNGSRIIAPATFLVTNALDGTASGPKGSLRNAIAQADVSGGTIRTEAIKGFHNHRNRNDDKPHLFLFAPLRGLDRGSHGHRRNLSRPPNATNLHITQISRLCFCSLKTSFEGPL